MIKRRRAYSFCCGNRLLDLSRPVVMGVLNTTPDSFYAGSRVLSVDAALRSAEQMLAEGAAILDIGGASTRPGAEEVPEEEELRRVLPVLEAVRKYFPEAILSIDTWRARVAQEALDVGASLVNDVSAGRWDAGLLEVVARYRCPYILMHARGTPKTMQQAPFYSDVVREVLDFFIQQLKELRRLGICDIAVDPGFGFGKTLEHNYTLLQHLATIEAVLDLPLLVGVSRKSMVCRLLGVRPEAALNGTTALHVLALLQGVRILRVHDVREAIEAINIVEAYEDPHSIKIALAP
ncbi:MAG: dihydropteroate synthase [Saprospiraceae bacterium]|nr:dihydropteroate synthase [Saprospiraceae bacterium]MDW8483799.1 dihydropteroate synthase [Saprospiraceae bacterium]